MNDKRLPHDQKKIIARLEEERERLINRYEKRIAKINLEIAERQTMQDRRNSILTREKNKAESKKTTSVEATYNPEDMYAEANLDQKYYESLLEKDPYGNVEMPEMTNEDLEILFADPDYNNWN